MCGRRCADGGADGREKDGGVEGGLAAEDIGSLRPEGEEGCACQVEDGYYPVELGELVCGRSVGVRPAVEGKRGGEYR